MRYTNVDNLPEVFEAFGRRSKYSKGDADYSVTQLIGAPRMDILFDTHRKEITSDVSEDVFALLGSAVHHVLEHGASFEHVSEERLFLEILGKTVSGQIDLQEWGERGIHVTDFKTCSVWSVMLGEKREWTEQLNCYGGLVEANRGEKVSSLKITAILRDWKRRESEVKSGYPSKPIVNIPIEMWRQEDRIRFLEDRVRIHEQAREEYVKTGMLPMCSPEEMWMKPTRWAVHKGENIRATRVFEDRAKALAYANSRKEYKIKQRAGEVTRCAHYCKVADWCGQYRSWKEANEE